jgi:hypothetical protein
MGNRRQIFFPQITHRFHPAGLSGELPRIGAACKRLRF